MPVGTAEYSIASVRVSPPNFFLGVAKTKKAGTTPALCLFGLFRFHSSDAQTHRENEIAHL